MPFATGIRIVSVPGVVELGDSRIAGSELARVTVTPPWFEAPRVKLVLVCNPLPTVTAPTEIVGCDIVIVRVAWLVWT